MTIKVSVCNLDHHGIVEVFYRRPKDYPSDAVQESIGEPLRPLEAKEFYVHSTQEIRIAEVKP